jgi:hypothetical protein
MCHGTMPSFLWRHARRRRAGWWAASALVCGLCGCGDNRPATYPVQGSVRFKDGGPVPVGIVEFRLKTTGEKARGRLGPHGKFTLKTFSDKEGALPGEHHVVVIQHFDPSVWKSREVPADAVLPEGEHHDHEQLLVVDRRYAAYGTTTLTATVNPQAQNPIVLTVESAKLPISRAVK